MPRFVHIVISALTLFVAVPAVPAAPLDDARAALVGQWIVQVGSQNRQRMLIVESVENAQDGGLAARARYSYIDVEPARVQMSARAEGGVVAFDLTTQSKSKIVARMTAVDKFEGTFTQSDGKEFKIVGTLDSRDVPKPGTRAYTLPTNAKVTMLFVTAWDCYYCGLWIKNELPKWRQEASFKAVDYRYVEAATFRNIENDSYWPAELRWVRDELKLKSGTPRFIVIADGKVVSRIFGTYGWRNTTQPMLADYAQRKIAQGG